MKPLLFSLFEHHELARKIADKCHYEIGEINIRQFPDQETYVRINSEVKNRNVIFIASLNQPNSKFLPLIFACEAIKDQGAKTIGLVAPYLPYMRQDIQFHPGESVTSKYFAALLSKSFSWLMTVDPHLHRHHFLKEIYSIPAFVIHASEAIAQWLLNHIEKPFIIGPDEESEQWIGDIARRISAPFVILEKMRKTDRSVEIQLPDNLAQYKDYNAILIDDIISTGKTMIEAAKILKKFKINSPVFIGIHGVFSQGAYQDLLRAGFSQIITCNTVPHESNGIDLSLTIADWLSDYCKSELT